MYQDHYYMGKLSGTYADTLAAYGLAALLTEVLAQVRGRALASNVVLEDAGPYYLITFSGPPLTEAEIEQCTFIAAPEATGYPLTGGRIGLDDVPPVPPARDVDATWERVRLYHAQRKQLQNDGRKDEDLKRRLQDLEPAPNWQTTAWLGDYRMQAQALNNRLVGQWYDTRDYFTENLKAIMQLAATPTPDLHLIAVTWGKATGQTRKSQRTETASQLFNPHQGKGLNEPKANRLRMDNVQAPFWLLEYLKVCGLWLAAVPRQTPDKERKTYVISPVTLPLHNHRQIFNRFSRRLWQQSQRNSTSLKLDITSILLCLQALLDYGEVPDEEEVDLGFDLTEGLDTIVSGLHVVQYKLLSRNSYTMTHMGFLGLPSWAAGASSQEDLQALRAIIREHLRVIRGIDEEHSDGFDLLRSYRDFAAGGSWEAFFDFTLAYSHYLMSALHAGRRPRPFSIQLLRRLFTMKKQTRSLAEIVENEGFHNIAYAIRHSTIVPQGQMARAKQKKGEKPLYDIRYGLGQELKQKANDRREFMAALGDFLSTYSAETYQKYESKGMRRRRDIHASDLDEITHLIERFGSEVVCNMLVAYGYASDYPDNSSEESNSTEENNE